MAAVEAADVSKIEADQIGKSGDNVAASDEPKLPLSSAQDGDDPNNYTIDPNDHNTVFTKFIKFSWPCLTHVAGLPVVWTGTYKKPSRRDGALEPWGNLEVFKFYDKVRSILLLLSAIFQVIVYWFKPLDLGFDLFGQGEMFNFDRSSVAYQILTLGTQVVGLLNTILLLLQARAVFKPRATLAYRACEKLHSMYHGGNPPFVPSPMSITSAQMSFYGTRAIYVQIIVRLIMWNVFQDPTLLSIFNLTWTLVELLTAFYAGACCVCALKMFSLNFGMAGWVPMPPHESNGIRVYCIVGGAVGPELLWKNEEWVYPKKYWKFGKNMGVDYILKVYGAKDVIWMKFPGAFVYPFFLACLLHWHISGQAMLVWVALFFTSVSHFIIFGTIPLNVASSKYYARNYDRLGREDLLPAEQEDSAPAEPDVVSV
eukprot:TRINITY_DN41363_c0_g1_i1.p1 TRINITY_DN41363_c0_g1~~TRINITY_DN41363_c0_g1_i1.p1  ORF type:complete len:427 (-),score=47.48 TRINITY_DN41363_c0_g1_i1:60-1340(-)